MLALTGSVLASFGFFPNLQAAPRYTAINLNYSAIAMSANGWIVAAPDTSGYAVLFKGSQQITLIAASSYSVARCVNNAGTVAGFYKEGLVSSVFVSTREQLTRYGGSAASDVGGINDAGTFVGVSSSGVAYRFDAAGFQTLGTLGGPMSTATAINNAGVIVGFSSVADSPHSHAFRYVGGKMEDLGNLDPRANTLARAINDEGVIVGDTNVPYSGDSLINAGFIFENGKMRALRGIDGWPAWVRAVNRFGWTVGTSFVDDGAVAVVWPRGSSTSLDLNELAGLPPRTLGVATGIDELGRIVAGGYLLTPTGDSLAKLANISTRSFAGSDSSTQIAGFIVTGNAPRKVLIRAGGPYLTQYGVEGVLADPVLTIFEKDTVIATNDDWGTSQAVAEGIAKAGAVNFAVGSKDAAIVTTLKPNTAYTAQVTGKTGSKGNALVEVYDIDDGNDSSLGNISTRSFVGTGSSIQIAGFILHGDSPRRVLIRAGGPYLAQFGVQNVLADPIVRIFRDATEIASNDDWGSNFDTVESATKAVNGTPFTAGSKDAAISLVLEPDQPYTVQVSGKNGTSGNALVEVFTLP